MTANSAGSPIVNVVVSLLCGGIAFWLFGIDKSGEDDWVLWVFAGVAGAISLLTLLNAVVVLWMKVKGLNVEPSLVIPERIVRPGGQLPIEWTAKGDNSRMTNLQIFLMGDELFTPKRRRWNIRVKRAYRNDHRSAQPRPHRHSICHAKVAEITDQDRLHSGRVSIDLPLSLPPTFESADHAIEWRLRAVAATSFWLSGIVIIKNLKIYPAVVNVEVNNEHRSSSE